MYIYRKGTDDFGALALIPQDFFKFWDGDVDTSGIGTYTKPLDALPEVTWEINYTADEWRTRIANADAQNPIDIARLRGIPDSYIEAVFLNTIYGYNMSYSSSRATYLPLRMGDTFTTDPSGYPGYAMVMLGLKTVIEDEHAKGTSVGENNVGILRSLLRHITYVAVLTARLYIPLQPTGNVFIAGLVSAASASSETVFYDPVAMESWVDAGGSEALAAANWVENRTSPTADTLTDADSLLAAWKTKTDLTAE